MSLFFSRIAIGIMCITKNFGTFLLQVMINELISKYMFKDDVQSMSYTLMHLTHIFFFTVLLDLGVWDIPKNTVCKSIFGRRVILGCEGRDH